MGAKQDEDDKKTRHKHRGGPGEFALPKKEKEWDPKVKGPGDNPAPEGGREKKAHEDSAEA